MMMMTAKVNIKKLLIALAAAAALIIALISLLGGKEDTSVPTMSDNDNRVAFLEAQGLQVTTSPKEAGQVKIPTEMTPVYSRYNELQKSQGYDLSQYAGKTVMRYVYEVKPAQETDQPVYATLLVYKNRIVGGDITDTGANGTVRAIKQDSPTQPTTAPDSSQATE